MFKRPANHEGIKGHPVAISHFAMQFLEEQVRGALDKPGNIF